MSILHRGAGPFPELARLASKLGKLAEDLERIARGEHPSASDLQDAPILFEWKVYIAPVPYLVGIVLGHPHLRDGCICHTSELYTFDPTSGYARTLSRFYRLSARPKIETVQ
ncbi:hypothetical protein MFUR16E_28230 [Methylobacterium fujisawaense]|uniref:DUF6634 family protein n=1 Tax=Methylobacterium fujisawaense TaxID=107400 RepID=UPI002F2E08AF